MLKDFQYRRITVITFLLVAGFLFHEGRLYYLQVQRHSDLGAKAAQYDRYWRGLDPWRGEICARNGEVLVFSFPVKTVYADLAVCSNRLDDCVQIITSTLHLNPAEVMTRMRSALAAATAQGPNPVLCLKRNVSESDWDSLTKRLAQASFSMNSRQLSRPEKALLRKLRHKAVFAEDDQARMYSPAASTLGHLLGYTSLGENGHGLEGVAGLEKSFNPQLAGMPGLCLSQKDAGGKELAFRRDQYAPPRHGSHLVLTIDLTLQALCDKVLAAACAQFSPSNATILMIQPNTGEILAWAAWPPFDPANPADAPPGARGNQAIIAIWEPGSTFKIITLAVALNENVTTLDQVVDGEGGLFRYRDAVLHDRQAFGLLPVREALMRSVNVVFAKLGIALGPQRFHHGITNFGFGRLTGIPLPGESVGYLKTNLNWPAYTQTRIPIGQAIGVTQLQMALAACAIGYQGRLMRPLLISQILGPDEKPTYLGQPICLREVITPQAAQSVLEAMTGVVSPQGTGRAAMLSTHTVAGKTGTSQLSDTNGYLADCYFASFVGLVPARNPQLCIYVAFNCPTNGHTGGLVAAPVFREVARQAVVYQHIPPDITQPGMPAIAATR